MRDLINQKFVLDGVEYRVVDVVDVGAHTIVYVVNTTEEAGLKIAFHLPDIREALATTAA